MREGVRRPGDHSHTGTVTAALWFSDRPRTLSSAIMPRLLVVHHTPSPALQEMFEAAVSGARTDEIDDVEVVIRPALTAAAADVLEADGYLLGTPANIGYMSGALKHFFDGIYYPCLEATRRRARTGRRAGGGSPPGRGSRYRRRSA